MALIPIAILYIVGLIIYDKLIKPAQDKKIDAKIAKQKEDRGF